MTSDVSAPGSPPAWWARLVLGDPQRVEATLARLRDAGVIDVVATHWQIVQGIVRMWHRVIFRSDTVGTCTVDPPRPTPRARLVRIKAIRLPVLLHQRVIAPFDFSGLLSSPDRIVRYLMGAHHDGAQFVYDLELLRGSPGALERLRDQARAVVEGRSPRGPWLRDLVVFERYHERLLEAVEKALRGEYDIDPKAFEDPDVTLTGYLRWCCAQPATPSASFRHWPATLTRRPWPSHSV